MSIIRLKRDVVLEAAGLEAYSCWGADETESDFISKNGYEKVGWGFTQEDAIKDYAERNGMSGNLKLEELKYPESPAVDEVGNE